MSLNCIDPTVTARTMSQVCASAGVMANPGSISAIGAATDFIFDGATQAERDRCFLADAFRDFTYTQRQEAEEVMQTGEVAPGVSIYGN